MNVSVEKKIAEAVRRMKALNIYKDAIALFQKHRRALEDYAVSEEMLSGAYAIVMCSEPPLGSLYFLDDEQQRLVREFENKYDALVYLVVRCYTDFGMMDSFLYVSDCEEEWETDLSDVRDGHPLTYTYNHDSPDFSEFGSIGVIQRGGGLVRTA